MIVYCPSWRSWSGYLIPDSSFLLLWCYRSCVFSFSAFRFSPFVRTRYSHDWCHFHYQIRPKMKTTPIPSWPTHDAYFCGPFPTWIKTIIQAKIKTTYKYLQNQIYLMLDWKVLTPVKLNPLSISVNLHNCNFFFLEF